RRHPARPRALRGASGPSLRGSPSAARRAGRGPEGAWHRYPHPLPDPSPPPARVREPGWPSGRPAGGGEGRAGGALAAPASRPLRRTGGDGGARGEGRPPRSRGRWAIEGRVLVVVPTYNERENVLPLLREIVAQGPQIDAWVADDKSPDGTADAVREAMREHPGRIELLEREGKGGRGAAVIAAFKKGLSDP